MAIKTNKSAKSSGKKTLSTDSPVKPKAQPASFEVRPIDNGFIVRKSWRDKNGDYQSSETYSAENPVELTIKKS